MRVSAPPIKGKILRCSYVSCASTSETAVGKPSRNSVTMGVSGSKESRPQLNRLLAGARARKFDAVLIWKLDRFGRSLKHLVNSLAKFESLGITFVSLRARDSKGVVCRGY